MASTNEVSTKGMISVSHSQCPNTAISKAMVLIKKITQYKPFDFFLTSCISMSQ